GRQLAEGAQERVVRQGLHEQRATTAPQNARDLAADKWELGVMENADAEHQVEGASPISEMLGGHDGRTTDRSLDLADILDRRVESRETDRSSIDSYPRSADRAWAREAYDSCRNPGRDLIVAGTPTARPPSGTEVKTTALAPILASSPTSIGPRILAPAPIMTRSPIRGAPVATPMSPSVTP